MGRRWKLRTSAEYSPPSAMWWRTRARDSTPSRPRLIALTMWPTSAQTRGLLKSMAPTEWKNSPWSSRLSRLPRMSTVSVFWASAALHVSGSIKSRAKSALPIKRVRPWRVTSAAAAPASEYRARKNGPRCLASKEEAASGGGGPPLVASLASSTKPPSTSNCFQSTPKAADSTSRRSSSMRAFGSLA